tara:strand:+ start:650 stop:1297 length:648 start_codon:yes stop_codon:yes gene_type:complete
MFTVSGKTIQYNRAWTHPDTGVQYPANWLRLTSLSEKQAVGLVEVTTSPDAVYDQRFYWGVDNPKQLDDVTDDDGNVTTGLKTQWKNTQSDIATSLLNESDKRVIKALDEATSFAEFKAAKPANYTTYRAAVRTACNTRQSEIDACADVPALKELLFGEATITRQQTDSEGNGVVEPDTITDEAGEETANPIAGQPVMETVANPNLATAWPNEPS